METIADRIEAILREKKVSASALSESAGLTRVHVNKIIKRVRENPDSRIENATLEAIAKAGGVTLDWLMTGRADHGTAPPLVQTALRVEHTERYPGRAEAAKAMRGVLPDPAVDSVLRWDLNATQDPGALWWIERMKEAARQLGLWQKDPAAERRELEKRRADGDALEAEELAFMAQSAAKPKAENDDLAPPTGATKPARKAKR